MGASSSYGEKTVVLVRSVVIESHEPVYHGNRGRFTGYVLVISSEPQGSANMWSKMLKLVFFLLGRWGWQVAGACDIWDTKGNLGA